MPTIEEIRIQIGYKSGTEWAWPREVKSLPTILWDDEKVEALIRGNYYKGGGILIATNKRLLFIAKGLLFGLRVEDFPYNQIVSIQFQSGLGIGRITVFASGNQASIEDVTNQRGREFTNYVRARITPRTQPVFQNHEKNVESDDAISKLERLVNLKKQGFITDEEFSSQKKKLIG